MTTFQNIIVSLLATLAIGLANSPATHADTETELREAVSTLNSWLGASDKSSQWRQLLELNVLDTQAALGLRADPQVLDSIADNFHQSTSEIDHPVFNRVARAIERHLLQMQMSQVSVDHETARLTDAYYPLSAEELEAVSADAAYKIKMLKRYYKKKMTSRPRALLFYNIRPDETIDFINSIEFKIAPKRSTRTIKSEIEQLEEKIEAIDQQIDKLNEQRSTIEDWMNDIESPKDVDPPMPDDDVSDTLETDVTKTDGLQIEDQQENPGVSRTEAKKVPLPPVKRQEIERLELGRMWLLEQKENLQSEIDELEEELEEAEAVEKVRVQSLRAQFKDFNRLIDGWESEYPNRNDAYYAQAFSKLQQLRASYMAAADPRTASNYPKRLENLRELNSALQLDTNDRAAAAELGDVSGWLESAGQATNLVATVRRNFSKPNLYFELSNSFANRFVARTFTQYQRVNEQVLSRLIRGIARVDGSVNLQFQHDPYQVNASVALSGSINSDTYTKAGRLTAYAGAHSDYFANRKLLANIGGMYACDVDGDLTLDSYFKCIDSNLRIVQKIAQKQYLKSKALSESISRERTRDQLFPQFADETDTAVDSGMEQFAKLNTRQTDNGKFIPSIYMHTTADRLVVVGHKATKYDLAAPADPYHTTSSQSDISIKVHESALSNYITPILAGKRFTNTEIAELFQGLMGTGNEESDAEGEAAEEFSIEFADIRPIQIEFEENTVAVVISGQRFSRGDNVIKNGLKIRVAFRFVNQGDHLELEPVGGVEVDLIDPKKTNITTVSFKSFLQDQLTAALDEATETSIELPMNLIPAKNLEPEIESITSRMRLTQFNMQRGWLYLGWLFQNNELGSYYAATPAIGYPSPQAPEDSEDSDPLPEEDKFDKLDLSDQLEDATSE